MNTPTQPLFSLPLAADPPPPADWHGWTPLDAPEPALPQGAYGPVAESGIDVPAVEPNEPLHAAELLAPAGGPEAGFAAFHFGADAIYLGLKKFSARAEAENFTLAEVEEITAHAHSLTPRRRVFVTINTLIRQDELSELVEDAARLADIGVDAIILQDLGVYRLLREYFPNLELHASTQLAVHNRAGAAVLGQMGFGRVVLARELTFEEVRDITGEAGIETEVFIHGALCYSYSGLCLFSSQTLGRSGNRGKCAYSCRDAFEVEGAPALLRDGSPVRRDPSVGFPFSMKDLALPDHVPALRAAGVSCFKIEGRKKSTLYVATTTEYYRKLIDGTLEAGERPRLEADMQTVFSRPWTRLFVQSHKDKEVADRDTVGHRGTPIGQVEQVANGRLRFHTNRALQKHDGLQIDLPVLGKPFGFAIESLWQIESGRAQRPAEVFEAAAGSLVEVALPADYPELPSGAPVYCSSSQEVKQHYRHERPRPDLCRTRRELEIDAVLTTSISPPLNKGGQGGVEGPTSGVHPPLPPLVKGGRDGGILTAGELRVTGRVLPRHAGETGVAITRGLPGPFPAARDSNAMEQALRDVFSRLGQSRFALTKFSFRNEAGGFVPVSRLNALRRDLTAALEAELERRLTQRIAAVQAEVVGTPRQCQRANQHTPATLNWSIKVDRIGSLDALEESDLAGVEEVLIDIARDHPGILADKLEQWNGRLGRDRLRLALPPLTRAWEEQGLRHKIERLRAAGWTRWEAANLSAWSYLGLDPNRPAQGIDLATDWSVYVLNRLAAEQLLAMGVTRFTLSPEDGKANLGSLLAEFADQAVVIVHQDTPLFLAESCAYANLIGGCPGKANCNFESMTMTSTHGERVTALDYHCRTIVLNDGPFCLSPRLGELARLGARHFRADFIYRKYDPVEVRDRWRLLRAGKVVPGGHAANFERGVL